MLNGRNPEFSGRISAEEIARRLKIGRLTVYAMLEQRVIPAIRVGRRWIITRYAYEQWEQMCGVQSDSLLDEATRGNGVN